jgi:hypothetical protein
MKMIPLWKASVITLLALFTLAPMASAKKKKKVIIYYQPPSGTTWYEVRAEKTGPPVYTYTIPESKSSIYVYEAAPPKTTGEVKITAPAKESTVWIDGEFAGTTGKIMRVALEEGSHDIQLRDPQGKKVFAGSVDVVAGKTTEIKPDTGGE